MFNITGAWDGSTHLGKQEAGWKAWKENMVKMDVNRVFGNLEYSKEYYAMNIHGKTQKGQMKNY